MTLVFLGLALTLTPASAMDHRGREFIGFSEGPGFPRADRVGLRRWTFPVVRPSIRWRELIVSWNLEGQGTAQATIFARVRRGERWTQPYILGRWAHREGAGVRESVRGQKDTDAEVQTDTLVLAEPGGEVEVVVALDAAAEPDVALTFLGLSFADTGFVPTSGEAHSEPGPRLGRVLDVPQRSQMNYEGGRVWCSPTSASMVLAYWAEQWHRPEWNWDVPRVACAVYDGQWPGTGNWVFNTAWAGSLPGVRAYVTRLSDLAEVAEWIEAGVPLVLSVSYGALKGTGRKSGDGHLIVCAGFTESGDVVVNDPGVTTEVRRVLPRSRVAEAWAASHQTVYVIHPKAFTPPADRWGHWQAQAGTKRGQP